MYQVELTIFGDSIVRRLADAACIPMSEANTDYRAYLDWVAQGNTAEVIEGDPA
jgi:hypothetical protein